jgi:K+-transporting ATPase ATPase A chain
MTIVDWLQIIVLLGAIVLLTPLLGQFMADVFEGKKTFLSFACGPLERLIYRLTGVDPTLEMNGKGYLKALLAFNALGFIFLFLILLFQGILPLNPQNFPGVSWDLAFNTTASFITNTNWQAYAGETTLSYFSQMAGLTVQNFASAATGIAALLALTRGLSRKNTPDIGNFWVDVTRSTVYILLPLSIIFTLILVGQGVIQNFEPAVHVTTVEGATQVIPQGPAASQVAIKQLGTNGGGFFNVNSAHPYENPTPISNFLQLLAIIMIPAALTYTFGSMIKQPKQGWCLWAAMMILLLGGLGVSLWSEYSVNPLFGQAALMEGKEVRFGVTNSILWSTFTTATGNGSVNAMMSSLSPLAGGLALFNIMLGEIVFGGVGSGLYGMLLFVILTVFLAGLMVGRTPEYLGKKIEARDIKMTMFAILIPGGVALLGAALSVVLPAGLASISSHGPHGLSEVLYAFSSSVGNNGSAFAGLNANTPYYNVVLGIVILIGRFVVVSFVLLLAGNLAQKKTSPPSFGTFTTDNHLFLILLIGVSVIVGALTFFPALALGPIVEHILMQSGRSF